MVHGMLNTMSGLGGGFGGLGLGQMQGFSNILGLGGLGFNPSNHNNVQGINPSNLGNQGFQPQGLGLGGMIPNLQNLQNLQALQSLSNYFVISDGLVNPTGLGNIQNNTQIPNNMNSNEMIRTQF